MDSVYFVDMTIQSINWTSPTIIEETKQAFTTLGSGRYYNVWTDQEYVQIKVWFASLKDWYYTATDKSKYISPKGSNSQHGWIPNDSETGGELLNPNRKGDYKEEFNITQLDQLSLFPPTLKKELEKTLPLLQKKGEQLITHFEKILDVPAKSLVKLHNNLAYHQIRTAWYIGVDPNTLNNQIACGEHKDRNCFTLLFSENSNKKLQVRGKDATWYDVEYVENSMIVNIGILAELWTSGYLYAPYHRVLCDDKDSFTTGYFMQPHMNTKIYHIGPAQDKYKLNHTVEEIRNSVRKGIVAPPTR